jgi:predicted permease
VVGELALALVLTLGAGLLLRSFDRLRRVDPGFEPNGVIAALVSPPESRYNTPKKAMAFFDQLHARVRALPSVTGAALTAKIPLTGTAWSSDFTAAGWPAGKWGVEVVHREISPDYFTVMRVPLIAGRAFSAADIQGAPMVVIINEALAKKYFRDESPLGKRICFDKVPDSTSVWRTIVGVVGNERQATLAREPVTEFFAPLAQDWRPPLFLLARTPGDAASLGPAIRQIVTDLDRDLPVLSLRPMTAVRAESFARERFLMTLLIVFAGVGLTLAMVGVFGVMAHLVHRRTREMGIRIALGARTTHVR